MRGSSSDSNARNAAPERIVQLAAVRPPGHNRGMEPPGAALPVIEVDARGHACPVPTLRLRRALASAAPGAQVRLLADDPMARIDVPHFAREAGCDLLEVVEHPGGALAFTLRRRG